MTPGYESWSKDELIARLRKLEASNPLTSVWQTILIFILPEAQDSIIRVGSIMRWRIKTDRASSNS
jgi:hypothetical protein